MHLCFHRVQHDLHSLSALVYADAAFLSAKLSAHVVLLKGLFTQAQQLMRFVKQVFSPGIAPA